MFRYEKKLPALMLAGAIIASVAPEARAQTAGNLVCNKCVGTGDLAKKAVNKSRLKNNAVTGKKIKNGSVKLNDLNPAVRQLIADLQARVAALESQAGFVSDLAAVVKVDEVETDLNGDGMIDPASERLPRVLFEGVNVQVVNGDMSETTDSLNGLGNLIVGYNEPRASGDLVCSDGRFDSLNNCQDGGHVWARNHKSGSHNLIVGPQNAYSRTGGAVFGKENAVNRPGASVTGGSSNIARGASASVSGGRLNKATGFNSSVSGGVANTAMSDGSSVSGGELNKASGNRSSVSGGRVNKAGGPHSSVSGGSGNEASGDRASVSGGIGAFASTIGGWAAGTLTDP